MRTAYALINRWGNATADALADVEQQRDELRAALADARPWVERCRIPENDVNAVAALLFKLKLMERIDRLLGRS